MATREKNIWILILFILSGIVVGGLLGDLASNVSFLNWLSYGEQFGLTNPVELDLSVVKLTLGIMFKINIASIVGIVLAIYFLNSNLFVNIFGTSFFLRVDRLLDWSNGSGYQLEKGLSAIGSANLFGYGFLNTPLYFPEAETDFIFAVYSSNFGFLGSLFLISLITFFDIKLILSASKCDKPIYKYIMALFIYRSTAN